MKLSDYTIPQQKAITTSGSNIIVSAGAGSGKTQVLTQRVLYFVKNKGYKLENFLILTFTNLAAGEMKQRIRKTLLEEGLEEGNNVDVADITTFDSYALSLVKKYHFNLGISPNISIVDSNVISVRKRTLLNEIFETYYQSQDEVFLNMIKEFCFKDDDDIIDLTLDFYDKSMQKLDYLKYWDEFSNYYSIDTIIDIKNGLLKIMVEDFQTLKPLILKLPNTCLKKTDDRLYQDIVYELLEPLFTAKTYEEILELLNANYKFPNMPNGSSEDDKKLNTKIKNRLSDKIKKYKTLPKDEKEFEEYLLRNLPYARKIIEICKVLDSKIKEYKKIYEVYEFNDIAKMSLNLIKNNEDIRNEIKNRLKMIMIDEYQDTSIIQEEFISYIGNNNVYMVGDVKQSIYRFRNARSDIFTNKYNKYKLGIDGIAIDLNKNFRSRREVLDDINFIFKQIMTDSLGGANYRLDHVIEYGNLNYLKAGDNLANNNLEFLVYEKESSDKQAIKEAKLIATDIINKINQGYLVFDILDKKPILRKCRYSDFCILMDRGSKFEEYLKVFTEYQIPIFAEQDENIKDNQITMSLTNILKLLKAILNHDYRSTEYKKAFIGVARSFVFNCSDQMLYEIAKNNLYANNAIINQIKDLVYKNNHLSIAQLCEEIIYGLDIYHKLIRIGNVNKNELYINTFTELFKSMSKLDYSLDDFILYMKYIDKYNMKITLQSQREDVDSVRIMNIHKSKGLEFNITYFSGLTSKFNQKDLDENFGFSEKYGLIFPPYNPNDINLFKELNKAYEKYEDLSEKIRLFYVALTRAREKMIFLYPLDEDDYEVFLNNSNEEVSSNEIVKEIEKQFELFKKDKLSLNEFVDYIGEYNYELTKEFSILDINKQKEISDVNFVLVDRGDSNINLSDVSSFKGFLEKVYYYNKFKKYTLNCEKKVFVKNHISKEIKYENLKVMDLNIICNQINTFRASKKLDLTSSKNNMDFGNELHFLMEITDFKNPDYSIIENELHKEIIKKFLSSELTKNISESDIYKEYQFYNEEEKLNGIIDLMVVYDDYIDIIDYKTKNINDEGYIEQLKLYKKHIKNVFNKPINCYLYSLLTGNIKEV